MRTISILFYIKSILNLKVPKLTDHEHQINII